MPASMTELLQIESHWLDFRYVLFDTPGQIEVFTWSASGSIISEALVCVCVCVSNLVSLVK